MSGRAMEWARRIAADKHLPAGVAHTLVSGLAYHANSKTGRSWVAVDTLAAELHVHPKTITVHLAAIEKARILEVYRRRGWTTVWIFPAEARWTPRESFRDPPRILPEPPHNSRGDQGVTPKVTTAPPPGKTTFLTGTGWV